MSIQGLGNIGSHALTTLDRTASGATGAAGASAYQATSTQTAAAPLETKTALQTPGSAQKMEQLDDATKKINTAMKELNQSLEFSIDTDSDRLVLKVVDTQTKEVIRQMPSEETLEIAKAIDRLQGLLIKQKA
jgi:flagellar protein FlaG